MLPVPYLRPCVWAIAQLVKDYGASAVLCTATQPALSPLFQEFAPELPMEELCPIKPEEWDAPAPSAPEMDETGRIVELIRSMPERYREALELRFAWEYSNQEIAKALKLNTSTVATLVARGRKLLIEKLQTEGYCYE